MKNFNYFRYNTVLHYLLVLPNNSIMKYNQSCQNKRPAFKQNTFVVLNGLELGYAANSLSLF